MTTHRKSRIWLIPALLAAFVLCQGQMCGSGVVPAVFKIVGSPDASLDGAWALTLTTAAKTSTTTLTLANGVATVMGSGSSATTIDGSSYPNPVDTTTSYTATCQAGRDGVTFTMQIVFTYSMPNKEPSTATETLTFTGTIAANGTISGSGTHTVSAPGYEDDVKDFTFTMTKQ